VIVAFFVRARVIEKSPNKKGLIRKKLALHPVLYLHNGRWNRVIAKTRMRNSRYTNGVHIINKRHGTASNVANGSQKRAWAIVKVSYWVKKGVHPENTSKSLIWRDICQYGWLQTNQEKYKNLPLQLFGQIRTYVPDYRMMLLQENKPKIISQMVQCK